MTTTIHPAVNNNGTSRVDLVDQRRAIIDACDALVGALRAATPNGRDYPGETERLHADRETHYVRITIVQDLREAVFAEALSIQQGSN